MPVVSSYSSGMSQTQWELGSTFLELREALARAFPEQGDAAASVGHTARGDAPLGSDFLQAAVALVLRASPDPDLLLIRRARSERDPWSGHMALPGGRRDPEDTDLLHTALRETHEETGIDLSRVGRLLGRLGMVIPRSAELPRIQIAPFVLAVPAGTTARANASEVDATIWTPLATFTDPRAARHTLIEVSGGPRSFPSFQVGDDLVWGLTYRIITEFLRYVPACDRHPPGTVESEQ